MVKLNFTKKQLYIAIAVVIVIISIIIGIYFGTKKTNDTETPITNVNTNKVIHYSQDIVPVSNSKKLCADKSLKYVLKSSPSTQVLTTSNIPTDTNKYIELGNQFYLKLDNMSNDIYLIKTNKNNTKLTERLSFFGKVLAYIPSEYCYLVWLDFSKVSKTAFKAFKLITDVMMEKTSELPRKSFYKLFIHNYGPKPKATIKRLNNVYVSDNINEDHFYCERNSEDSLLYSTVGVILNYVQITT